MSQYTTLKTAIQAVIKENGNNEITGPILQQALLSIIDSLGVGFQFVDIATPATNPGTPDQNVFYIAGSAGTYSNFNGLVVSPDEIAILAYNGAWAKKSIPVQTLLKNFVVSANIKTLGDELEQILANNGQCLVAGGGRTAYSGYKLVFVTGSCARYRVVGTNKFSNSRISNWGFYSATPSFVGSIDDNNTTALLMDGGTTVVGDITYFDFVIENDLQRLGAYLFFSINTDCDLHIYDATNEPVESFSKTVDMPLAGWIQQNGATFIAYEPFITSKRIQLDDVMADGKLVDLFSQRNSNVQLFGVHVYDSSDNHIGLFYAPNDNGERYVSFNFDLPVAQIIETYPTAKYIRIGGFKKWGGPKILGKREYQQEQRILAKSIWDNNRWRLTVFHNAIFVGDSVTQGFVVQSNGETSPTIYQVESAYSYPTELGKLIPFWEITNAGISGISPINWLAQQYPNYDFTNYDLAVIELGYNGGLSDDISTPGTQSYAYRQIVAGIVSQNPSIKIMLVLSSCSQYSDSWKTTLDAIAQEFNQCSILDIRDHSNQYFNLSDRKYHGYDGTQWDYVHFNRIGYAAKANFVYNKLCELL